MNPFFTYVHARPTTIDANGIFYVGKGYKSRAENVSARNRFHGNVVRKYGRDNILIGKIECSSEQTAFDLERGLIKCLRRMGIRLSNQTGGGEGTSNPSPELREKLRPNWDDFGAKAVERNKARVWTPEMRARTAPKTKEFMLGRGWITNGVVDRRFPLNQNPPDGWVFGRLWSGNEEFKRKVGASQLGNNHTLGNRWITNGVENKQIKSGEQPPLGWEFGRAFRGTTPASRREAERLKARPGKGWVVGHHWITNDFDEKLVTNDTQLPAGWRLGRLAVKPPMREKLRKFLKGNTYTLGKRRITNGVLNTTISPDAPLPPGWRYGITRKR